MKRSTALEMEMNSQMDLRASETKKSQEEMNPGNSSTQNLKSGINIGEMEGKTNSPSDNSVVGIAKKKGDTFLE